MASRRQYQLRTKYDMTEEQFEALLENQDGVCAVCRTDPGDRRLCVDHDHDTGNVRGLLCTACNTGIGMFDDNTDLLRQALRYLLYQEEETQCLLSTSQSHD